MSIPTLLDKLQNPTDIHALSLADKAILSEEVRQRIIHVVSKNGGHLAPSLGVVELTMALLSVFNPAEDKVVWDVGHQSYAWKILTGRNEAFSTLRQYEGLSGFPKRDESPYDHFGVGHASTSISAALGIAMARDLAGLKHHVVAVIGDGSLSSGLAFEGLNQAGALKKRLIVVLNDNEMSISRNVGALSLFLSRNMEREWARRLRREVKAWLKSIPGIGEDMAQYAQRTHKSLKNVFTPGMLFEALRFNYIGPVNGHDQAELETHLRLAASFDDQPVLLHVLTQKGRGYEPAVKNPASFHGLGSFDIASGEVAKPSAPATLSYTDVFSQTLCKLAKEDTRIIAITAAMSSGTGTQEFKKRFPERFVDVGICEQHALTFAAGLASQGYKPFAVLYSTFAQRAYDQIVHDIALQNLPVTLCLDRAGLVGEDGPTHHGVFDISYIRHIPNISFIAPRDAESLQAAIIRAVAMETPVVIRYPRGATRATELMAQVPPLPLDTGVLLRDGDDALVLAVGSMVMPALDAATSLEKQGMHIAVFDPQWLKPLPVDDILHIIARFTRIVIMEENVLQGGFGSSILELLSDNNLLHNKNISRLGIPDAFITHGKQSQLLDECNLTAKGLIDLLTQKQA